MEKLIAPDRDERFASADDLWDALSAWPIPARDVRLLGTVVRAARREVHVPNEGTLTAQDVMEITGRG